ncbi:MAG: PAS domain-containing protein [Salinivirgaceae bacterium]
MKFAKKLQARVLILVLTSILFVFLILGFFIGYRNHQFAIDKAEEYTQLMADKNSKQVESILNVYIGNVATASNLVGVQMNDKLLSQKYITDLVTNQIQSNSEINSAWLTINSSLLEQDNHGSRLVVFRADAQNKNQISENTETAIAYSLTGATLLEPYKIGNQLMADIVSPIMSNGIVKGYYGITLNLNLFADFIKKSSIVDGGFITVLSSNSLFVAHSNPSFIGKKFSENFPNEEKEWTVENKVEMGQRFSIQTDFQRKSYYSYFVPIKLTNSATPWALEVTVPMHKMLESSKSVIRNSILVALLGLLFLILIVWFITKSLVGSISEVTGILELLSRGNTRDVKELNLKAVEELQQMSESLNKVVDGLRLTENFALGIGKGNLEEKYELLSTEDQLGEALLNMRESLKHSLQEEEHRKEEEEIRNWATHGIAMFGDILRQDSNQMKKLGYNITSNLVNYLDVNQGAFFVINDEHEDDIFYELVTAIAYERDKFMQKEIRVGEGLVGRCIFERKTIFLTEVPSDYANITSGLGTANPTCILIVPCILNDQVYGVIEIASFKTLKPHEIAFVEKLGESIAATISNVKINEKTNKLLSASQNQSEELAAQEEELRQNLEEMEATQEDLKRQMETNEQMRLNMRKQNTLLDALMNSLPDYIYFKDKESKFIRVSLSMIELFGFKNTEDLIGKSDFDFHNVANAQKYYDDEQNIIRNKKGITNQLQKETMTDGSTKWMSVTKLPLLTNDGECIGTFGISKDVSEYKNLELDAKQKSEEVEKALEVMRAAQEDLKAQEVINSKMRENELRQNALLDALLNSLPDFIYFKDEESRFIRISKSLISLFGAKTVDDVVGKSDYDYHTPENARKFYEDEMQIIKSRKGIVDQLQEEIMPDGSSKWVSVTKLPLLTNSGDCIGTFGISKDVTELKILEIGAHKREVELNGLLNAVKASTYIIEYATDGTILEVNQALLDLFKIKKEEIIGTNHKQGIEMVNVSEKEYKAFWNDLRKGITRREKTKIVINNKEVWLSETYTPILDADNIVIKVLKIAFDITSYMKK